MSAERQWIAGEETSFLENALDPTTGERHKHIYQHAIRGTYWHGDETNVECYGPFSSIEEAKTSLDAYSAWLNQPKEPTP